MSVDDSYTKALLHFDGADTSTTITDESGKTWTPAGTAQIDTAQNKFGTASLLLDGNSDYIYTPDSADWALGTGDFTIDCWIKRTSRSAFMTICAQSDTADNVHKWQFYITDTERIAFIAYNTSGVVVAQTTGNSGSPLGDDNWHHVAVVRNGKKAGCLKLYVDGSASARTTNIELSDSSMPDMSYQLTIGRCDSTGNELYFNGWIDEFRFSKGIARWTSDFTPQAYPYCIEENTTETISFTDTATELLSYEVTSESLTITDTVQNNIIFQLPVIEALTFTDIAENILLVEPTTDAVTITDIAENILMVEPTTDVATFTDISEPDELIRKRVKFPNLQGKHLSIKFESATDGSFAIYYLRHKMFKTRELTYDQKHPNTHGSHIGIKLSNSGSDEFILMYVSEKMQLVTT
jgi:hypothetical protein